MLTQPLAPLSLPLDLAQHPVVTPPGRGGRGRGRGRGRGSGRGGGRSKKKCWNCGSEEHGEPECPQPKDPAHIAANKKAFCDAKKKAAKWAPPTLDEKSNGNKRLIGGKLMQCDPATSRWNPVDGGSLVTPPGPAPAPTASAGTAGTHPTGSGNIRCWTTCPWCLCCFWWHTRRRNSSLERNAQRDASLRTLQSALAEPARHL